MARIKHLIEGEFTRLNKYNLFVASLFVGLLWVVMAYFLSLDELLAFLPFVFLMESSMMTAILVGAEMFYEKKEHTISSMLISPITEQEYIVGKIIANILNLLIVFGIITLALYFIHDFLFQLHWLVISVSLVCAFYVLIGIVLSYVSKDFTALLINYMLLVMVLVLPTLLAMIGILDASVRDWLFWGPTEATLRLMQASFATEVDLVQFALDFLYISALSLALAYGLVLPRFKAYATRDLGV
jgi:fluoroquinolone transport system permease protein